MRILFLGDVVGNSGCTKLMNNPLNEIKSLIEDEKIKPIIDKVYFFSESIEAFTHLASGRAKGKIVVKIK